MTVSSTTKRNSYTGNGSTTTFAYSFKIFDDDDITVILRTTATGTETVQTKTTHYSVTGVGNSSGGNVVFGSAPTSAQTVVLLRQTAQTQATDYTPNDPFPAASHEDALDKLTLMTQDQQDELDRSIKLSRTNTMTSTEFTVTATNRANKIFAFDSSGELSVTQEIGTFRGDWAASTSYAVRDLVKDTSTNNIFIVNEAHTSSGSQPLTTNANSAKYDLIVDAAAATTSASAAASSATAAASSASTASTQASNASSSASTASTQASNAASSATAAASSATAAAASATSAATALDNFDDIFLGAKSSDPSTDNDGDALTTGDIYFNTSSNTLRVFNGSSFQDASISTTATTAELNIMDGDTSASSTTVADADRVVFNDAGTMKQVAVTDLAAYFDDEITAMPNLVTTGALNSGSITSGFGAIDNGSSNITTTGVITGGTLEATADTSAGDNAAIGFTSAEGLILTGQGSTSDVTIKNDADATVAFVPTGTDDLRLPDDAQLQLGDSGDLRIYHNGATSFIEDIGTGNFLITTNGNNIQLMKDQSEQMLVAKPDDAVELYYDNVKKLETTSTGVSVTGTTEASLFQVGSGQYFDTSGGNVRINNINNADILFRLGASGGEKMRLTSNAELGIGTSSPNSFNANARNLVVGTGSGSNGITIFAGNTSDSAIFFADNGSTATGQINYKHADNAFTFHTNSGTERMRIDSSGNVGIGLSSNIDRKLHVENDNDYAAKFGGTGGGDYAIEIGQDGTNGSPGFNATGSGASMKFSTGGSERMRLDSSGNLLVGKTASNFSTDGIEIAPGGQILATATNAECFFFDRSNDGKIGKFFRDGAEKGSIQVSSSGTAYNTSSDRRLKSNIQDAESASDKIDAIQVRQFDWNADDIHQDYGLIAQELQPIEPLAVTGDADSDEMMGVDYSKLVPILIKEIQELRGRVAALEASQ